MKKTIPDSVVTAGHPDWAVLSAISAEIIKRAGGQDELATHFPNMLRQCIDDVIMTPKTARRSYDELEKTEKTYIGTRVEIDLRAMLKLPKGKLDTFILGRDVDIKNTMGNNWMIPTEAIDQPCILVAADEERAVCFLGLIIARLDYLTASQNRDAKKSVSAPGFSNILWLLNGYPYPPNFWRNVPADVVKKIFSGRTGNQRMATLFKEIQGVQIAREVVEAVAQQKDFMRRTRSDNGRGTKDFLAKEGILLLSGHYDAPLIDALRLPKCSKSEFVSYRPKTIDELNVARKFGANIGKPS